ncbi:hypothetical protein VTJ04DRAFT_9930 [Mycothermus thermophilus]|uniref:uncharacterized protein n=1 Tax=Humicola insolens TaxID=85995 RepID=UPI00374209E9
MAHEFKREGGLHINTFLFGKERRQARQGRLAPRRVNKEIWTVGRRAFMLWARVECHVGIDMGTFCFFDDQGYLWWIMVADLGTGRFLMCWLFGLAEK